MFTPLDVYYLTGQKHFHIKVEYGSGKQEAVYYIQDPAEARKIGSGILDAAVSFDKGLGQVAYLRKHP